MLRCRPTFDFAHCRSLLAILFSPGIGRHYVAPQSAWFSSCIPQCVDCKVHITEAYDDEEVSIRITSMDVGRRLRRYLSWGDMFRFRMDADAGESFRIMVAGTSRVEVVVGGGAHRRAWRQEGRELPREEGKCAILHLLLSWRASGHRVAGEQEKQLRQCLR